MILKILQQKLKKIKYYIQIYMILVLVMNIKMHQKINNMEKIGYALALFIVGGIGVTIGMYISSQIKNNIKKNIEKYNEKKKTKQ